VEDNNFKAMCCPICIAFGSGLSNYSNSDGCTNLKFMYSAIERHEKSTLRMNAVEGYFLASKEISMEYLVYKNMMAIKKKKKVENNVHVLKVKVIFEIIKFLGRQNLSYKRSATNETLSNFDDITLNKCNFLEIIQFTAKTDEVLHEPLR
jgi:hypothetical protein